MTLTEAIKTGNVQEAVQAFESGETAVEGAPSAVLLATYYGKTQVAEALRRSKGRLDVFEAAAVGDLHQLEQILADDPRAYLAHSEDGFTPLGYAAFFGHLEGLKLLLSKGASPNVASTNPLKVMPLHSALANEHKEMARVLVEAGSDINASSGSGWTPLHYCGYNGDVETAKWLIEQGAREDNRNEDGKFPSDLAQEAGHTNLAEMLRPKGG